MEESRSAPPHEASSGPAAGQPSAPAAPPEIPFGASAAPGDGLVAAGHPGAPLSPDALRTNLADFALAELVRQHRGSFAPLWTIESWAKLLIWLALNSGCSGDTASLEAFAASLGPERSGRLRRLFFSREFEASGLRLWADPAEGQVRLEGEMAAAEDAAAPQPDLEPVAAAMEAVGLTPRVVADRQRWQRRPGVVVIPLR